jgi:hypothetical protein
MLGCLEVCGNHRLGGVGQGLVALQLVSTVIQ